MTLSQLPGARRPWKPFSRPVPLPSTGVFDLPLVCVSYNESWQPYVLGALKVLTFDSTWESSDPAAVRIVTDQAQTLLSIFSGAACFPEIRDDPDDPGHFEISDDGTTWVELALISDLSAFLINNPSIPTFLRNIIHCSDPIAPLAVNMSGTCLPVQITTDHDQAIVVKDVGTVADAVPLEFWQQAGRDNHFLELESPTYGTGYAINRRRMWLAPGFDSIGTPVATDIGGLYRKQTDDGRPHFIYVDEATATHDKRLEFGLTFNGDVIAGDPTIAPTLTPTRTGDAINYELALNSVLAVVESELTFDHEYTELAAGATPVVTIERTGAFHYMVDDQLPPIPLPTDFAVDNTTDATLDQPTLDLSVVGTGSLTTVKYTLKSPPPNNFAVPDSGAKHYRLMIDANGSVLPFLLPSGYTLTGVTTSGFWAALDNSNVVKSRYSQGLHTFGDTPYPGDLVGTITTGTPDDNDFLSSTALTTADILGGITAIEDCYIKLFMFVQSGLQLSQGQLYIEFDVNAPAGPTFDWSRTFSGAVDQSATWKNVQANGNPPLYQAAGAYWTSGVSGWILRLKTLIHRTAACTVQRVKVESFTQFPGSVSAPLGNRAIMTFATSGNFDVSDQAPIAAGSGTSTFDGLAGVVDSGDSIIEIDSESFDHATGGTNDQEQRIISITIAGSGTEPTFSTF